MPPQQRLRNCAGRVWPKYRYVAWAAVGLKGFGRRQVAFVGPPKAVLFCELPALFYLHFPSHRLQSSACQASRRGGDVRQSGLGPGIGPSSDGVKFAWHLEGAGDGVLAYPVPGVRPTGLMW